MWPTNLRANERPEYVAAMVGGSTKARVEVDLLDLDHRHVQSLDLEFDDGQVNFNRGSDVVMSLQAGFVDPGGDLLDLDLRYLIRVKHHLWVPALGVWAVTPQFTGQVVAVSSDGGVSTVEAHDKMALALLPGAPRRTLKAGRRVAGAIQAMFEDIGETKFRISPSLKAELKDDAVSGGPDENKSPARVAQRLAARYGLQVFYDELGFLVVRDRPGKPVVTWSEDGDVRGKYDTGAGLLSDVRFTRDLRGVRNRVIANGKKKLSLKVEAPKDHVHSARSLRRGGKPGWRDAWLDAEQIGDRGELRDAASKELDRLLTDHTDAQFETVPVLHVGPWDRVRAVKANGRYGEFFLTECSKPLLGGDDASSEGQAMTVGYQQRVRKRSAGRMRL